MKFALDASGAQMAGQGIGNVFKALAMGQQVRDKAEQDAMFNQARIAQAGATARKNSAEALLKENQLGFASNPMETAMLELGLPTAKAEDFQNRLATGQWGGQYAAPGDGVGPTMPAPADDDTVARLGQTISLLQRMYGTGSNVQQGAAAALTDQQRRNIDRVIANPTMAGNVGRAYAATEGKPLFENVGNTGYSLDNFGGGQTVANDVLAKLFAQGEQAQTNQRNASAASSAAQAGLTNRRLQVLNETGSLPGSGSSGEDATNAKTRNQVIAAIEREMPGLSNEEFAQELALRLGRRGISVPNANSAPQPNKNPATPASQPKMSVPQGMTSQMVLDQARAAIAQGKDRNAVIARLREMGVDPKGL